MNRDEINSRLSGPIEEREDPLEIFSAWYAEAVKTEKTDPDAAALATVGADGMPAVRMVLIRGFSEEGFVFHTNYDSRKADHLVHHPVAAFCLHWKSLGRQIRVEGSVSKISTDESDAYFSGRPRESQIGAWASLQSRPLSSPIELQNRVEEYAKNFTGEVPRPPHWGGYRLTPVMIEFWRQGEHRLHNRLVYTRQALGGWSIMRLYP